MVDYSRFDHIGSSSDDDDDDQGRRRGAPMVHALDGPSTVTFGGGRDARVVLSPSPRITDADDVDELDGDIDASKVNVAPGAGETEVMLSERELAEALERRRRRGSADSPSLEARDASEMPAARKWDVVVKEMSRNGGVVREDGDGAVRYFWRQDAKEASASVVVAPKTKAKDVRVDVSAREVKISVMKDDGELREVFRGEWAHEIAEEPRDEDEDDGGGRAAPTFGDWEITDFEGHGDDARRVVRVTVRKKSSDMLVHWWRSCVKGGPEVDPMTFEDRSATKASQAQTTWEQAQAMFRERIANREMIEVDTHTSGA